MGGWSSTLGDSDVAEVLEGTDILGDCKKEPEEGAVGEWKVNGEDGEDVETF